MRSRRKMLPLWEPPFSASPVACMMVIFLYLTASLNAAPSPPYMIKQPPHEQLYQISIEKREDRPVVLDCEAKGDPIPTYRWTKNGQAFSTSGSDNRVAQAPGRGTLTIHRPQDIDEGLYQCFAENSYGISLSNAVYLRLAGMDTFRAENTIHEIVADEGQQLTLKCNPPTGNPKPNIFWNLQSTNGALRNVNGSRIAVDVEGDLHFSNITLEDSSGDQFYVCSAHSHFLRLYKTGELTKLTVRPSGLAAPNKAEPVCQYTSPKHITGMRGQDIDILCIYGGTPLPQIRWERKGAPLPARRFTTLEFGKILKLKNLDFEDQGSYECTASNGVGQVRTHAFTLTVESVPFWVTAPETTPAAEGEDYTFACEANGVPVPQIQWFVNGTPIENEPHPRRVSNGSHVTITKLQNEIDTDNYQCNASNVHGYIFADVFLNVMTLGAEIIDPPPALSEAVEGSQARIRCKVYGAPKPTVDWEKDGQIVSTERGDGNRYELHKDGDLLINSATFADTGAYTCKAHNRIAATDKAGKLEIRRKTVVQPPLEPNLNRQAGQPATLRCSVESDPNLRVDIEWQRDGEHVELGQNSGIFQNNDNSLTISQAQEVHSGTYTCVARTHLDQAEGHIFLTVRDVPKPPTNVRVQCSQHAGNIEWEASGENREPISEFMVQYSTAFEPGEWKDMKDGISATDTSTSLELSPWVDYTFRVKAKNSVGWSNESVPAEGSCNTPGDIPYKNPDNIVGKGTTPTNLVISWTPMPQIDHNGPGFYYQVKYTPADTNTDNRLRRQAVVQQQTADVKDWRIGSHTVTGLETYVPYDVTVVAVNDYGMSREVNAPPVRGYSGEDRPTEAVKDFFLSEKGPDGKTADVYWQPVDPNSIHGKFEGYKLVILPDNDVNQRRESRVGPNDNSTKLVNLKPASKNMVTIMPYNSQYDGPAATPLAIETPEGRPGPPSDFHGYPMGRGAIFLQWKPPAEPNGKLLTYEADVSEVHGLLVSESVQHPIIKDISQNTFKLVGLQPDTVYRINLYATTSAGPGEHATFESATEANRTMEALALLPPPGEPSFTISGKTNNSIIVTWQPQHSAAEGHRPGEHFYVEYKREGDGEWQKTDAELEKLSTEVTGLEPGTTYDMRVVAVEGDQETRGKTFKATTEGVRVGEAGSPFAWATSGWFIAFMCLVALGILICLILCVVCRSKRGGKYAVNEADRTRKPASYDYEKAPTIPQGIVNPNNLPKIRPTDGVGSADENASIISREGGSEADSMEEYGDPDQPKMFTEDGSWIGQYASNTVRSNDAVVTTTVAQHPTGSTFV